MCAGGIVLLHRSTEAGFDGRADRGDRGSRARRAAVRGKGAGPRTTSIGEQGGAAVRGEGRAATEARDDGRAAPEDVRPRNLPKNSL